MTDKLRLIVAVCCWYLAGGAIVFLTLSVLAGFMWLVGVGDPWRAGLVALAAVVAAEWRRKP